MTIIVKTGTSTVTHDGGEPNMRVLVKLARVLSDIAARENNVILVTSGAIAVGAAKMKLSERPTDLPSKQAAAAVGQCALMHAFDSVFSDYGRTAAQILLSREDLDRQPSRRNLLNTFKALFTMDAIVVVNENDSVSAEEIEDCGMVFGDNDRLSAEVAALLDADLLVLLSDIDAVYDGDPRINPAAKKLSRIYAIDDRLRAAATGPGSARGTGGMLTKLQAAEICLDQGIPMVVAHGGEPDVLYDIMDGKDVGTMFRV